MHSARSRYLPGSLVRARGRDWVVLPSHESDIFRLRPLTGSEEESIELFLPLEGDDLAPSEFPPPDPAQAGDAIGARLLFDAARLSLRSTVAPFRALARIGVVPRPYQFVPLLMALRQRVVRLLIADDVGVGKTIEAALVARELLDRGLARRLLVLCPPHLCSQWESELRDKFGIEAVVVQPATIGALERQLPRPDINVYAYYPHIIASIDYVKNDRVKRLLVPQAPDLAIVDEAHAAARPPGQHGRNQQLRHALLRDLMGDNRRHLILVTATPHSGVEESFRSLLGLLDARFDPQPTASDPELPPLDLDALTRHIVQRRRANLVSWLGQTRFPKRRVEERPYALSLAYRRLFESVLHYCRESVDDERGLSAQKQRVRYWAALALLRCVLSSPAAAVAVLERRVAERATDVDTGDDDLAAIDARYRQQVPDPTDDAPTTDSVPTAPLDDPQAEYSPYEVRQLQKFCKEARELFGARHDAKLVAAADALAALLAESFHPIVFCRYIDTATYLAEQLPDLLAERGHAGTAVVAVTGELTEDVRAERVRDLATQPRRVLVATDCLSEGINLQDDFDAVLHYELPWNPNRLEQREGRVDRFGQTRNEVRAIVLYGQDNPLDITVLDVLVRKARAIREQLGISVPVPLATENLLDVLVEQARNWLRRGAPLEQLWLIQPEEPRRAAFESEIDRAAEREQETQAFFAQHAIPPDMVEQELRDVDLALGSPETVRDFLANALQRLDSALLPATPEGAYALELSERARTVLRDHGIDPATLPQRVAFAAPPPTGASVLSRTSPIVAALADYVIAAAFRPGPERLFARCGALVTRDVRQSTILLLLRLRYRLSEDGGSGANALAEYGEEVRIAACVPESGTLSWLAEEEARRLLKAQPAANLDAAQRADRVRWALAQLQKPDWHDAITAERRGALIQAHARVRARFGAPPLEVHPYPPDILACFVLVPPSHAGGAS